MTIKKLSILALFAVTLAGCSDFKFQNPFAPAETPASSVEESSSVVTSESTESSSSIQAVSIVGESSSEQSSTSESKESESSVQSEDEKETTVTFTFYVDGEQVGSFDVKDAVGQSVLDAMKSNPDIPFSFNKEEGVIDTMFDTTNDYETGRTWLYLLNDQMAELGVVSQKLSKGDRIDWHFGTVDSLPVTIIPASE